MFQFSAFASPNLCIQFGMTALVALPGFPIQKSSGHSSFDNSPKLIAVYYVFHRLSAPRHPPCALYSLIIHPTPSKPEPRKAGISTDCSNLSILRHLMFGLDLHPIAHYFSLSLSSIRFSRCLSDVIHPVGEACLYALRRQVSNSFFFFFTR